jgi:hypothetical protein
VPAGEEFMILLKMYQPCGPVCPKMAAGCLPMTLAISYVSADGSAKRIIAETGLPNGLTVDLGNIWVAEAKLRALLKVR